MYKYMIEFICGYVFGALSVAVLLICCPYSYDMGLREKNKLGS
jgi:hypothetical protein